MTNSVPPADKRAHMRILTEPAAKTWRDGCLALYRRYPRYQTRCAAPGVQGGVASGQPNYFHLLAAALLAGYREVTDANVSDVLTAIDRRARERYGEQTRMEI